MKIVISRTDGGISIMGLNEQAAEAARLAPEQLDVIVAAEIAQWPADQQALVTTWREMPDDAIPVDRTFRDAWSDKTLELKVDIDLPKAKEIVRKSMKDPTKDPLIDAATTPDELKAILTTKTTKEALNA